MIKLYGTMTDPAGRPVPGALIELRALSTSREVLMGSVLTFKCGNDGRYSFDLAAGTYDVYAQNDLCRDMDYMGVGAVTAQSLNGPLNSILIAGGIDLTPPLVERAVQAMEQAEKAALDASRAQAQIVESAHSADRASQLASDQAGIASREAAKAEGKAGEAAQSAKISSTAADVANKASTAASASEANAKRHAIEAEAAAQVSENAKAITLEHVKLSTVQSQQVAVARERIEGLAKVVDDHSANVSSLAKEVGTNTAEAIEAKASVKTMQETAVTKAAQAIAAADTASNKARLAAQDQAAASVSAQHASLAESMAEAWAQNPEGSDINGRPGEFSALHWAMQAQKWAHAIISQLVWAGPWNAAAGAPLAPAKNQGIPFYRVSHPGVISDVSFGVGDYLHWDPTTKSWFKIDGADAVISVNGMTGAVVLGAADVGARPASWVPKWDEVTNKPVSMPPSEHAHLWSQISGIPKYASRWPSWAEVTDKPPLAAADHTHPYMKDGGSYGTLYLSNWIRSTGDSGWYNETYGGGVYMSDTTWLRVYNDKKLYVSSNEFDALNTAGGVYASGNGNFNDVYIRSDRRLKSDITPIISALGKLKRLTGWVYTKNGQREAGLIAQEVAEVQPESVYINADGYLSLASAGVVALVIEAIKELDKKIEVLNADTQ
ncbi:prophage tail fiber N-terminal domain-containing protein [Aeromonas veronii]